MGVRLLSIKSESNTPYKDKDSQAAKESSSRRNKKWYDNNKNREIIYSIPETKKCNSCGEIKDKECFYRRKNRPNGLSSWCIDCLVNHMSKYDKKMKTARRLKNYGITEEEFNILYAKQKGRCEICGVKEEDTRKKSLCVDHDHETGKIRGLLCDDCNVMLGRARDNPDNLKNAIKYLSI